MTPATTAADFVAESERAPLFSRARLAYLVAAVVGVMFWWAVIAWI